jgi:hypothetical protein
MDVQWLLNLPQQINGGDPSSKATLALKAGDLLTASVLEVEKGHDALIAFGQFKAYARLPLPVVSGQTIQIQVQQADQKLRMVMLPNGSPASSPPNNENLQIRLFEPVSDRPQLSAHSNSLVPGQSMEGRITGFSKDGLMLVDFGKFKAFAKIDIPVREGQILPLTVIKTDQGIAFSVGTRTPINAPSQASASPVAHEIAPDMTGRGMEKSTLPAEPIAQTPSAPIAQKPAAVILSADKPVVPQPSGPLSPPTAPEMAQLRGQIQQLLGHPDLPARTTGAPLSLPTQAALTNIQQLLRPVSATGDSTTLMATIKDFVENSGIYFEKRMEAAIRSLQDRPTPMTPSELAEQPSIRELMVKDLKPNLLILKQFFESQPLDQQAGDRHLLETMKSVVERTLAHIEQQQSGATEKPVDPNLFQAFSHLLLLADHRRDARLKVYYAKKGRDEDDNKNPRVALLLEMDRMGTVRSDLWMVGRDLNITFFVQTAETKAAIHAVQDEIKTALNESFNTVAVSIVVSEKKIAQFDEEDLGPSPRRLLDLSI